MIPPLARRAVFAGLALLFAPTLHAQPSQFSAHEQWYNRTDDGHRQYIYEMGNATSRGDTVVVLHGGWGAEHSYLLDPLEPLADRYRFVLYDQRGSLRSPAADSTITLDRMVADLEDLRQALGQETLTLVAHSMGNALAYAYLAQHPDRVERLVLMAPVHPSMFRGSGDLDFARRVWPEADSTAMMDTTMAFFEGWGERAYAHLEAAGLVPDSLRGAEPQTIVSAHRGRDGTRAWRITFASVNSCTGERWREMQGGQVFYNQRVADALMGDPAYPERAETFLSALEAFEGPVRILIGTCDYVDVGPLVWPHVPERLHDASLTVIDGAGHSIWMDQPEAFVEALSEALSSSSS